MTVLIIGYPESGKSVLAEHMVMENSAPEERIYLATMIPYGEDGEERVARHRRMREGKGFITVEAPFDLCESLEEFADKESIDLSGMTVLLECVSNLAANELFERGAERNETIEKVCSDISSLAGKVRNLIIVTNHFEEEECFDEETLAYAGTLDRINERLSRLADDTVRRK